MESSYRHDSPTAVFATDQRRRQRLLRAAGIGGAALLAVWLIALALGAQGGFDPLPSLPDRGSSAAREAASPSGPSEASAKHHPAAAVAATRSARRDSAGDQSDTGGPSSARQPASEPVPVTVSKPKRAPAPTVVATTTTQPGKRIGATQNTGKPVGSPGNGPGGTGPPGQSP